jgi:hemerythrin-like domain-containing protein
MPRNYNQEQDHISLNNHFNIVDILLLDHSYLKDCIDIMKDKNEDKKIKLKHAKSFLDALKKHSAGEKKALYAPLEEVKEFRAQILESEIEHGIVDSKVRTLLTKVSSMRSMNEDLEAEMKVLAEIVEHHVKEEEKELLPKMRKYIDKTLLNEMGFQFMVIRQFSEKDLKYSPELKEEVSFIKKSSPIPSAKFLSKTHEYFSAQLSLR